MFSQYFVLDEMIVDKLLIVNGELGVVLLSPFGGSTRRGRVDNA
jgi:hypothetical protein